jgi:hypothetical protein
MTQARYLLCPGDGCTGAGLPIRRIGAMELASLYGVQLGECVILPGTRTPADRAMREAWLARAAAGEIVALGPRVDGDYRLLQNGMAVQPS